MKTPAAVVLLLSAAFAIGAQDKPAAGSRTGVLNLRDCMDKTRNAWIAEIEHEIQKLQEAESGRAIDLNPQERARIRTKLLDLSNRRKLEVYIEIVRVSGEVARERGFDLVQRIDRMPVIESGDTDLTAQIDRRLVVHHDVAIDLTSAVLERINRDYAARKK
jgi:Skp family chaperone for outer membrane proteins